MKRDIIISTQVVKIRPSSLFGFYAIIKSNYTHWLAYSIFFTQSWFYLFNDPCPLKLVQYSIGKKIIAIYVLVILGIRCMSKMLRYTSSFHLLLRYIYWERRCRIGQTRTWPNGCLIIIDVADAEKYNISVKRALVTDMVT